MQPGVWRQGRNVVNVDVWMNTGRMHAFCWINSL
jgi:hypothetical protein